MNVDSLAQARDQIDSKCAAKTLEFGSELRRSNPIASCGGDLGGSDKPHQHHVQQRSSYSYERKHTRSYR